MISLVNVLTDVCIFKVEKESLTSDVKVKYIVDFGNKDPNQAMKQVFVLK